MILLIIQNVLGIGYNLYGTMPTASKKIGLFSSPLLALHVIVGTLLVLAAIYLVVAAVRARIAALAFAASAWKCAPRDTWIGWDAATRTANLDLIWGNARFLIRPDITVPNLASWLLAAITRRLPTDWLTRYGYAPVLAETFVDPPASPAPATALPTAPASDRHRAEASSTAFNSTRCPSRTSTYIPRTGTGARS